MNSLKRQASKAERYAKLRDEMRAKLRMVLASKFAQLESEAATLEQQLHEIAEEIRVKTDAVQQMEAEHGERTQRGYAIEREGQDNREKLNSLALDLDRASARRRTNEERCAELDARSAGAQAEIVNTEERLTKLQDELQTDRATLESASSDVANAQQELQERQQEASAASTSLVDVERQQEARRAAILQAVSSASSVRNRITQAEERIAALDRETKRLLDETAAANQQLESFGGQRGQLGLEFESSSQRVNALASQITDARQQLEGKRTAESESKRHLDSLRGQYASLMGKKGSLESVIAEHGYATESVRKLFTSGALQGGRAPAGVLADFLEVEGRYEHVVDDFLRDELNYIVVKSWDAADEGLRLLRTDVDGRATFLVHPGRLASKVLVPVRRSRESCLAQRRRRAVEKLHSRARRLRQVAGSDPAKAGQRLHRSRPRGRPQSGVGESGRVLPVAVGRVLPQRDGYRRQAAQPGTVVDEARAARSPDARWANLSAPSAKRKPTSPRWAARSPS